MEKYEARHEEGLNWCEEEFLEKGLRRWRIPRGLKRYISDKVTRLVSTKTNSAKRKIFTLNVNLCELVFRWLVCWWIDRGGHVSLVYWSDVANDFPSLHLAPLREYKRWQRFAFIETACSCFLIGGHCAWSHICVTAHFKSRFFFRSERTVELISSSEAYTLEN